MITELKLSQVMERWPQLNKLKEMYGLEIWSKVVSLGWVAGGCIRSIIANEEIADVDVFFRSDYSFLETKVGLMSLGGKIIRKNSNIVDIFINDDLPTIQLVRRWFDSPKECLLSFDFTVTMFAMDDQNFYMGAFALDDLMHKRIVVNEMPNPISSTRRLLKYLEKGYSISESELQKLADVLKETHDNYPMER